MPELGNYTRWTADADGDLAADLPLPRVGIEVSSRNATVMFIIRHSGASSGWVELTPDEARMIGVRLIEGAALAAGGRAIREPSAE